MANVDDDCLSPNSLSFEVILAYFVNTCTVFKLYLGTFLDLWVLIIWTANFLGHGHALSFWFFFCWCNRLVTLLIWFCSVDLGSMSFFWCTNSDIEFGINVYGVYRSFFWGTNSDIKFGKHIYCVCGLNLVSIYIVYADHFLGVPIQIEFGMHIYGVCRSCFLVYQLILAVVMVIKYPSLLI